jgi:ankyrin repeat protein
MALYKLPNELLCMIANACETPSEMAALAAVNRRLYDLLNPILYRINVDDYDGSALFWGAYHGILGTMEKAYDAGAELNDATGCHALSISFDIFPQIFGIFEDSLLSFMTYCPIHLAVISGHAEAVSWLLSRGSRVTSPAKLLCSCLKHPYDPNTRDIEIPTDARLAPTWTPLHLAICNDHPAVAELLINMGADLYVEWMHTGNYTAYHAVGETNSVKMARLLTHKNGGAIHIDTRTHQGNTALHFACRRYREEELGVLDELLKLGPDLSVCNRTGQTALGYACDFGCFKAALKLIRAGAPLTCTAPALTLLQSLLMPVEWYFSEPESPPIDAEGWEEDRIELINLLISMGASPNEHGRVPNVPPHFHDHLSAGMGPFASASPPLVMTAVNDIPLNIMETLLARGADPEARDRLGCTALWYAISHQAEDKIRTLLRSGARLDGDWGTCRSPMEHALSLAEDEGDYSLARRIVSWATPSNVHVTSWLDRQIIDAVRCRLNSKGDVLLALRAKMSDGLDNRKLRNRTVPGPLYTRQFYEAALGRAPPLVESDDEDEAYQTDLGIEETYDSSSSEDEGGDDGEEGDEVPQRASRSEQKTTRPDDNTREEPEDSRAESPTDLKAELEHLISDELEQETRELADWAGDNDENVNVALEHDDMHDFNSFDDLDDHLFYPDGDYDLLVTMEYI